MRTPPSIVRPWAELRSTLPDDAIWEGTDAIQIGGKTVAEEIGKILDRLGCQSEPPGYAGEHGWDFYATYAGNRRLFCQVTHVDHYIVLVEDRPYLGLFRKRPNLVYWDLLTKLAEELDRDPRFSDVVWHTADTVASSKAGAGRPIGDQPPLNIDHW